MNSISSQSSGFLLNFSGRVFPSIPDPLGVLPTGLLYVSPIGRDAAAPSIVVGMSCTVAADVTPPGRICGGVATGK